MGLFVGTGALLVGKSIACCTFLHANEVNVSVSLFGVFIKKENVIVCFSYYKIVENKVKIQKPDSTVYSHASSRVRLQAQPCFQPNANIGMLIWQH